MKGLFALVFVVALGVLALSSCARCAGRPPLRPITVETVVAGLTPLARLDALRVDISGVVEAVQAPEWAVDRPSRLVLIVRGSALYGVPELDSAQVTVRDDLVHVRLPAPVVVESWVDVARSRVWLRRGGVLSGAELELDTVAWRAAADMVREAATSAAHLAMARRQAEGVVVALARRVAPGCRVEVAWVDEQG